MDLIQVLTLIGVAIANIGTTITLFLWSTNHAAEDRRAMDQKFSDLLKAIQDEMKDFHGRLARQDADFKNHLMYFHANDPDKINLKK